MLKLLFSSFVLILFITSCSQDKHEKKLSISTNSWIGYAPLFYAKEQGLLDTLNIQLITSVSLAEASEIYSIGKADIVTTTQHEFYVLQEVDNSIVPIILLDRSNGGDVILSNQTIQKLKKSQDITVYLETDSINNELIRSFIQKYDFDMDKMKFINKDQAQIQNVENNSYRNIIIVTYSPYNLALNDKGFQEIASTQGKNGFLVIDALCTTKEIAKKEHQRLLKLKHIIDNAIIDIKTDPKKSYTLVSKYLLGISYKEYVKALHLITWINNPSKELLQELEKIHYSPKDIIL